MASSKKPGHADLAGHLRAFLTPRLFPGARLCLGYSGGLDSSVLLHALAGSRVELDFRLSAVHVHHGLSPHADVWEAHCREACRQLGVPLSVRRVEVEADGGGVEAAARVARYRAYAEMEADFLVLAHHRDDQAETFLFRLLRGAGIHGLAAMAAVAQTPDGRPLLRPLLPIARATLAEFARAEGIGYVDDESNHDTALARNWLRHEVVPLMEARFPAASGVLARTAEQCAESATLLDSLAELDGRAALDDRGVRLDALAALDPARARNLLRYWLRRVTGLVASRAWLEQALTQLTMAAPDRHPGLVLGPWTLCRRGGRAVLVEKAPVRPVGEWRWRGEPELPLGEHGHLRCREVVGEGLAARCLDREGLRVTFRLGGERFRPDCRRPGRALKNLLRESGVPVAARGAIPLAFLDDRLAWVAGLGVDCAFQAGPDEPGWLISWCPPNR